MKSGRWKWIPCVFKPYGMHPWNSGSKYVKSGDLLDQIYICYIVKVYIGKMGTFTAFNFS